MTALLLLSLVLTAGEFRHVAADGGLPEMTLIPTESESVAMLVTFGTGYGDDFGLTGLSAQAQTSLTQANAAFPLQKWTELAFAGDVHFRCSLGRYQTHFVLSAPRAEFPAAARMLLPALLAPRLDRALFQALKGRASPLGSVESDSELLVQLLEPLVLEGAKPQQRLEPAWLELSRIQQHLDEFITPANATVTVIGGFDPAELLPLLSRHAQGTRRVVRRAATRNDVDAKFPAERSVHLIGYPLPELTALQAAAVRVIDAMMYETLTIALRERGLAYSIFVEPNLTPWFNGVLLTVPAFEISGSDLEPFLVEQIGRVVHQRLSPETLQRFKEGVQLEDALARQQPKLFVHRLVAASVSPAWLSPEYAKALEELTPEQVSQASSALFVNERRRFYVKFVPLTPTAPSRRGH